MTRPDCGAVVVFGGTVRDHAEGRPGVTELEYEAYAAQVEPRLAAIAGRGPFALARRGPAGVVAPDRAPGRHRMLGRGGRVSAEHRGDAFDAARFCIDTLKTTVPIWKRERWAGGDDWGQDAHDIAEIGRSRRYAHDGVVGSGAQQPGLSHRGGGAGHHRRADRLAAPPSAASPSTPTWSRFIGACGPWRRTASQRRVRARHGGTARADCASSPRPAVAADRGDARIARRRRRTDPTTGVGCSIDDWRRPISPGP